MFVLSLLPFLFSSTTALARSLAPSAGQIQISSVTYHGDGCPDGTAVTTVSPDAQAFTIAFSQFAVSVGPDSAGPSHAQCHLHLMVSVPKGWSYAVDSVDYVGYASLDAGVTGSRRSSYHLSGETPEKTATYTWPGGFSDEYFVQDVGAGAPLDWSKCGGGKNLLIDTQLSVNADGHPTGAGLITVDAVDGEVYHLLWRTCP
jgi:hypothetical protein